MPIDVKKAISKPSKKTVKISAVDLDAAVKALNKKGAWATYKVTPTAIPKFDKAKKVSEVTIKAAPSATVPGWTEYSKSTKSRQKEWDAMTPKADKYVENHHTKFIEAVDALADAIKDEDVDKAGWAKLWKAKLAELNKVNKDYAKDTSNGADEGLELTDPGPDPVETATDIKTPKESTYNISGNSIQNVFKALKKRAFWGRYRSFQDKNLEYALDGSLKKITVKAAPVVTMPKWSDYSKRTKKQKDDWDNMWGILHTHEHNHHTIFTDGVDAMLKEVVDMQMKKKEAEQFWTDRMKSIQDDQDSYDSTSAHGVNEGVILNFDADDP